jgi:hypothetical protein
LEIYDYNIDLPTSGIKDNFKINLNDKNHITQQSFSMDGYVMDKAIGATVKGTPVMKIKMGQASVGTLDKHKPYIIDIVPKSGGTGDTVRLLGNNFINVDKVLLGEFPCEIDSYDNTYLDFTVSRDIFSGYKAPVYLISDGAEAISPTGYLVTSGMLIF